MEPCAAICSEDDDLALAGAITSDDSWAASSVSFCSVALQPDILFPWETLGTGSLDEPSYNPPAMPTKESLEGDYDLQHPR